MSKYGATLEISKKGYLTSISIPAENLLPIHEQQKPVEINVKKLFKSLTGETTNSNLVPTAETAKAPISKPVGEAPSPNRYQNIIDQLERKYCRQENYGSEDEEDTMLDGVDIALAAENNKDNRKKHKNKNLNNDDYDMDDAFIDDSELINEVNHQLTSKRLKTKHDGFFVSSGSLEVQVAPKSKKSKRKFNDQLGEIKENDINIEKNLENNENKKSKSSSTSENETNDNEGSAKTSENVIKPLWEPKEDVIKALNEFKEIFEKSEIKLAKSSNIPKELEKPLFDLHQLVLTHNPEVFSRKTGYFEELQRIFKADINPGKIKGLHKRIKMKNKSDVLKEVFITSLKNFEKSILTAIAPCPDSKQPKEDKEKPSETTDKNDLNKSAIEPKENSTAPALKIVKKYDFYCKWSIPLRTELIDLEKSFSEWIKSENEYRDKLTIYDKKHLPAEEVNMLNEKVEWHKILFEIAEKFPEKCLEGTKEAILKAFKNEKKRINRKNQKEKKQLEEEEQKLKSATETNEINKDEALADNTNTGIGKEITISSSIPQNPENMSKSQLLNTEKSKNPTPSEKPITPPPDYRQEPNKTKSNKPSNLGESSTIPTNLIQNPTKTETSIKPTDKAPNLDNSKTSSKSTGTPKSLIEVISSSKKRKIDETSSKPSPPAVPIREKSTKAPTSNTLEPIPTDDQSLKPPSDSVKSASKTSLETNVKPTATVLKKFKPSETAEKIVSKPDNPVSSKSGSQSTTPFRTSTSAGTIFMNQSQRSSGEKQNLNPFRVLSPTETVSQGSNLVPGKGSILKGSGNILQQQQGSKLTSPVIDLVASTESSEESDGSSDSSSTSSSEDNGPVVTDLC